MLSGSRVVVRTGIQGTIRQLHPATNAGISRTPPISVIRITKHLVWSSWPVTRVRTPSFYSFLVRGLVIPSVVWMKKRELAISHIADDAKKVCTRRS